MNISDYTNVQTANDDTLKRWIAYIEREYCINSAYVRIKPDETRCDPACIVSLRTERAALKTWARKCWDDETKQALENLAAVKEREKKASLDKQQMAKSKDVDEAGFQSVKSKKSIQHEVKTAKRECEKGITEAESAEEIATKEINKRYINRLALIRYGYWKLINEKQDPPFDDTSYKPIPNSPNIFTKHEQGRHYVQDCNKDITPRYVKRAITARERNLIIHFALSGLPFQYIYPIAKDQSIDNWKEAEKAQAERGGGSNQFLFSATATARPIASNAGKIFESGGIDLHGGTIIIDLTKLNPKYFAPQYTITAFHQRKSIPETAAATFSRISESNYRNKEVHIACYNLVSIAGIILYPNRDFTHKITSNDTPKNPDELFKEIRSNKIEFSKENIDRRDYIISAVRNCRQSFDANKVDFPKLAIENDAEKLRINKLVESR